MFLSFLFNKKIYNFSLVSLSFCFFLFYQPFYSSTSCPENRFGSPCYLIPFPVSFFPDYDRHIRVKESRFKRFSSKVLKSFQQSLLVVWRGKLSSSSTKLNSYISSLFKKVVKFLNRRKSEIFVLCEFRPCVKLCSWTWQKIVLRTSTDLMYVWTWSDIHTSI